jgi:hypothetical protein
MIYIFVLGCALATDMPSLKESTSKYLRALTWGGAPEKSYLVDRTEDLLTEIVLGSAVEEGIRYMGAITSFVEQVLLRDDLDERTINLLSRSIENKGVLDGTFREDATTSPADLTVCLAYQVLVKTGIDMFSVIPPNTIPHQDLIGEILRNYAISTFFMSPTASSRLSRMSSRELEHIADLSWHIKEDCARIVRSNSSRLIPCYPMYALLDIDVSDMTLEDILMGRELEMIEGLLWDRFGFRDDLVWMLKEFRLILEARRKNPAEVATILTDSIKSLSESEYKTRMHFHNAAIKSRLEGVEAVPVIPQISESLDSHHFLRSGNAVSDIILEAVSERIDRGNNPADVSKILTDSIKSLSESEYETRMHFHNAEIESRLEVVEAVPVVPQISESWDSHHSPSAEKTASDIILGAVLRRIDKGKSEYAEISVLIPEWSLHATPYDKIKLAYFLQFRKLPQKSEFAAHVASEFNLLMDNSGVIRLFGTADPRIGSVGSHSRMKLSPEMSDETIETIDRFRRLSFDKVYLVPFITGLCEAGDLWVKLNIVEYMESILLVLEKEDIFQIALLPETVSLLKNYLLKEELIVRNPIETMFMFLNAVDPDDDSFLGFAAHYSNSVKLAHRLSVVLRIGVLDSEVAAVVERSKERLEHFLYHRGHVPTSINYSRGLLWTLSSQMLPWITLHRRVSLNQALRWDSQLERILGGHA